MKPLIRVGLSGLAALWLAWPDDPCRDARERATSAWSSARHREVLAAYAPALASAAQEHLDRAATVLDEWVASWISAHDAACEASPAEVDARTVCLRASVIALEQLVSQLSPERASPAEALSGARSLPSVASCDGTAIVDAEGTDSEVAATERWLQELRARARPVGGRRRARSRRPAEDRPRCGHGCGSARHGASRAAGAEAQSDLGDPSTAGAAMETIYWEAVSAGRDVVAAAAAAAVLETNSDTFAFSDAETWVQHAESAARRVDGGEGMHTGAFLHSLGVLRAAQRRQEEPLAAFREAVDLAQRFDSDEMRPIVARQNVAAMLILLEQREEGIAILREIAALLESRLGPRHPDLAPSLVNLRMALVQEGSVEEGLELLDRSTAIVEDTFGPESGPAAEHQEMRGLVLREAGRFEDSFSAFDSARRIRETTLGADHPGLASAWFGMAEATGQLGRPEEAARQYQAVIDLLDGRDGHEYMLTGALNNLAFIWLAGGQPERAEPVLQRALELADARGDPLAGALPRVNLGSRRAEQGRPAEAVPYFEGALPHLHKLVPAEAVAGVHVDLADALWESGGDRQRARTLATDAIDMAGETTVVAERARGWLAEHPAP